MIRTSKAPAAVLAAAAVLLLATPATAAASPRAHHRPLFQEGFDRLPIGPVTTGAHGWTADVSDGSLNIERGPRGRQLHVHTEGNGRAFLKLTGLAFPGNSFWVRLRLRVAAFPKAPDWAHWTIAEASGADAPTLVRPLGGQYVPTERGNFWGVGSDLGPTGDWTAWQTAAPAIAGTWQCAEFHLDATNNRVTVYLNGIEQTALTVDTTHHGGTDDDFVFPTFDTLKLGWQLYQANPEPSQYDVYIDDITVSTQRAKPSP